MWGWGGGEPLPQARKQIPTHTVFLFIGARRVGGGRDCESSPFCSGTQREQGQIKERGNRGKWLWKFGCPWVAWEGSVRAAFQAEPGTHPLSV